ncbi:MAG: hypothetical protein ACI8XU_001810 [Kiritimatiellia bacterium]|jgi:hypothetical protein
MIGVLVGGINIARGMKSEEVSNTVADAINAAGRARIVKFL